MGFANNYGLDKRLNHPEEQLQSVPSKGRWMYTTHDIM